MSRFDRLEELTAQEAEELEKMMMDEHFQKDDREDREKDRERRNAITESVLQRMGQNTTASQNSHKNRYRRLRTKRAWIVLVAAAVLMLGTVVYGRSRDWDIEMAEFLGLSGVMPQLENGYVEINQTDKADDMTITITQAIGDKYTQWIEIDTNIPWELQEEGYYVCYYSFYVYPQRWGTGIQGKHVVGGISIDGGSTCGSFQKNGMVCFLLNAEGYKGINRSFIDLHISRISKYESMGDDEEEISVCEQEFDFAWKNTYGANTKTYHTNRIVELERSDGKSSFFCRVKKLELSPVSLSVEGTLLDKKTDRSFLYVDAVTLKDGTVITYDKEFSTAGVRSNKKMDMCLNFFEEAWDEKTGDEEEISLINGGDVVSVTIGGEEFQLK